MNDGIEREVSVSNKNSSFGGRCPAFQQPILCRKTIYVIVISEQPRLSPFYYKLQLLPYSCKQSHCLSFQYLVNVILRFSERKLLPLGIHLKDKH